MNFKFNKFKGFNKFNGKMRNCSFSVQGAKLFIKLPT